MSADQAVRAVLWAFVSTTAVVGSYLWTQIDGLTVPTVISGAVGLLGLVALIWKLVVDYRATSDLIDDYREAKAADASALGEERAENRRLRDELSRHRVDD